MKNQRLISLAGSGTRPSFQGQRNLDLGKMQQVFYNLDLLAEHLHGDKEMQVLGFKKFAFASFRVLKGKGTGTGSGVVPPFRITCRFADPEWPSLTIEKSGALFARIAGDKNGPVFTLNNSGKFHIFPARSKSQTGVAALAIFRRLSYEKENLNILAEPEG